MYGQFAALASALTWAASNIVVKTISGTVRPVPVSAVHTFVTAIALLILTAAFGRMDELFSMPVGPARYLVASAIANTAGQITFLYAISLGSVGWTFTMTNSIFIPLSVLAGWLVLGDEITSWTWVGGGAIMVGLYLLTRPARPRAEPVSEDPPAAAEATATGATVSDAAPADAGRAFSRGAVMAVLSGVLWVVGLVFTARGLQDTDLMAAATLRTGVPALLFILWAATRGGSPLRGVPSGARRRLFLSAAFSLCSLVGWMFALQNTEAGLTAILSSTAPVWALLFAALFLRERPGLVALIGTAICLGGGFVVVSLG